jgi:hypothetical protein
LGRHAVKSRAQIRPLIFRGQFKELVVKICEYLKGCSQTTDDLQFSICRGIMEGI